MRVKQSLVTTGRVGLTLVCTLSLGFPGIVNGVEPPRLISPEAFTQSVPPPPPPPAPPAPEAESPATEKSVPESAKSAPESTFEDPNSDDPALMPVKLHLGPLSEWTNLSTTSPALPTGPRHKAPQQAALPIAESAPENLQMQTNLTDEIVPFDLTGGGTEQPLFGPISPFAYNPLYFEEGYLERHGQSAGRLFQPLFSGLEFYTRAGLLPGTILFKKPRSLQLTIWPEPIDPAYEYGF